MQEHFESCCPGLYYVDGTLLQSTSLVAQSVTCGEAVVMCSSSAAAEVLRLRTRCSRSARRLGRRQKTTKLFATGQFEKGAFGSTMKCV
ncbi:unnamed protein product [Chondrus crispus]|uniref:Uncharacterized protein n=1 Tax=Chondrus crispus TaxID=2769 RepID=R7QHX3_CHOCR|nr:unnamed protein product [Chondrus crispus]CDF38117.1 unnamed protein product [Chondrus crispus]|eukprot:XP_005717986.1 unnamed protein product [Chondrus crispus]